MVIKGSNEDLFDELSRLNNELVNLQRDLAQKNAELSQNDKKLRLERDFAETLLNTAPAIILVLDMQGRILRVNRFIEKFLGHTFSSIPGKEWLETLIVPEDRQAGLDFFLNAVSGVNTTARTFRVLNSNSQQIEIEWHVSALRDIDGNMNSLLAIGIDATERAKNEELLRNKQKLESLGILAGGIAHNFNNLFGGIFGYIDIAAEITKEEKTALYLEKTRSSIDRALALTRQLLTFAKGGGPLQEILPLFPFVQETAKLALSGSNVTCSCIVPDDLWSCNFDKNQIGQVINNLVINAQQSMPDGGTIEIVARNFILTENKHPVLTEGNYVKLTVKDTGIGIPSEIITKIFDPFFTTKPKANGLGLSTCYSIINRHGGCIDVESEPGQGSTFTIYLPAAN